MNQYEVALLIMALVTAFVARGLPRAWLWLSVGALSFIISATWWRLGLPYHPAATLACDSLVCLTIYSLAKEEFEIWLFNLFRLSVLISLLKLFGVINENLVYASALEGVNVLAMLLIGCTGIFAGSANGGHTFGSWIGNLRRLGRYVRSPRRTPRWFDVPR